MILYKIVNDVKKSQELFWKVTVLRSSIRAQGNDVFHKTRYFILILKLIQNIRICLITPIQFIWAISE
jgi:hypothetical protein